MLVFGRNGKARSDPSGLVRRHGRSHPTPAGEYNASMFLALGPTWHVHGCWPRRLAW